MDRLMRRIVTYLVPLALMASAALAQNTLPPQPPATVEGQPIETRKPEKADDKPLFPEQTRAPYHASVPFKVTTLVDNLHVTWGMDFLPDGRMLLTERLPGALRILDKNNVLSPPLAEIMSVAAGKEIVLLDVAVDPKFSRNHRIFFTFCDFIREPQMNDTNTYVARARLDGDKLSDVKVIFRAIPQWPAKGLGGKTGGRILFGPDGNLFVTIGDRDTSPQTTIDWFAAQKLDNHLGKVIRITPDGAPAAGNPFIEQAGALPEIWAYGLRSPEGFAADPRTGQLWESELGPRGGDEINIIKKGANYGWPVITHGLDYPGVPIGDGIVAKDGMEQPVYYWDPVIAPSGLAYYNGRLFPQWRGSLLAGGLRGIGVYRLQLKNNKVVAEEPLLTELKTRIRDVRVGPDGAVYVLTEQKALLKLTPQ